MKQKFQIGEMVKAGMIVRAFHPQSFLDNAATYDGVTIENRINAYNKTWGEEWAKAPIYSILLHTPTKQISYEDWLFENDGIKYYKPEYYKEIYDKMIPTRLVLDVPEHLVEVQKLGEGGFEKEKENV